MSGEIRVTWGVEDGYAGRSRPHTVYFSADDFFYCDSRLEVEEAFEEEMRICFENAVTFYVQDREEHIDEIWQAIQKEREEDAEEYDDCDED